ncbi:uncharacterized protein LAESUDRAFT_653184 [Laetiporus sulphureus 93-53]|uniref:Uncharacterized protein n=1 Tax=Laetiporus sulphureus 93-53 TaxID=1314785 RepID=A0A165EBG5_9APHY|nr:uncharacterized protein LAESUDRAFT_653184 [Laetiporus sulphureus 93-53]KZT06662.1 hypothetical protein LAESUDRAFT_653184 [Laetiporus sulphureus 93-53]
MSNQGVIGNNGKEKQTTGQTLEIEDEEKRQDRMHELLMRLNSSSGARSTFASDLRLPRLGEDTPFEMPPPSDLLSRVQSFLPQLAASNAELLRRAQEDPNSVDIENVENDERYIEMNLGLGVFEQRGEPVPGQTFDAELQESHSSSSSISSESSASSDSDSDSSSSSSSSSDSDSSSDSSSEDEAKSDVDMHDPVPLRRPLKPLPKRQNHSRPRIVVLDEQPSADANVKK